ncbi:MAG: ABC transporter permease [Phycisphaerae bacterium]|nr:ABC transporter permease [Phycisphaerae bacterium]
MRKIIVIAVREYKAAVHTKAFIIMLVAMPVLMVGAIIGAHLLEDKVDIRDKSVAVFDRSGLLFDRLKEAAEERNERFIFDHDSGQQVQPRYLIDKVDLGEGEPTSEQLAHQCKRVEGGELFALVVIDPNIQNVEKIKHPGWKEAMPQTAGVVKIYSEATTFDAFQGWLDRKANEAIRELRFAAAELPKDKIDQALTYVPIEACKLVRIDTATGEVSGGTRKTRGADIMVPFFIMMLMFMVINIGSAPLINSVLEEKMQRIAEVLLGSVTPFQLMSGKLLGMVGMSMTILAVYMVGGVLGAKGAGYEEFIPSNLGVLVFWFILFQVLAVLMFGAVFIAVGAACSDLKESQSMLMPIYIFIVFPMFVWLPVIREPTSSFALALSLIPPATPMLMLLRIAATPNIPLWQPILGTFLVLLTTMFCVFVAGRIFRVGLLMQGKGAKFSDLIKWAVRG